MSAAEGRGEPDRPAVAADRPAMALDRNLVVTGVDERLADLLGHRPAALVGQPLVALVHPDDVRLGQAVLRGRPTGPTFARWRFRTAAGEVRVLSLAWSPTATGWLGVLDGSGRLLTLPTATAAITPVERLARVATGVYDIGTGATVWSPLMYELYELPATAPPPASIAEYLALIEPDDGEDFVRALQHTLATGEVAVATVRTAGRSHRRTLRVTLCCDLRADGTPAMVTHTTQDITDELAARTRLEHERERALAVAQAKSDFLARVTHELRTPVAGVIGMIDLAVADDDAGARASHLASARASARHLLELIDDLLDASRQETWRFNVVEIDFGLDEVLAEALAMVAPRAARKGLELRGERAAGLANQRRGDPLRLRQILVNLLYNAVKFTERGSVEARFEDAGTSRVALVVQDTGAGIAAGERDAVFEPYVRGGAGQAAGEGHGLGLTITRELVEALGGRIELSSTVGVGTRVTVALPLPVSASERSTGRRPTTDELNGPTRGLRVLVVEDHPINVAYLQAVLERAGHSVRVVGDGQAAVDAAADRQHDVALMDLELPGLDGLGATRAIRAAERATEAPRLPIVGLSAHRDRALAAAAAGMDGYLSKPVDAGDLAAELSRVTAPTWHPPVDHVTRMARVGDRRALAATIARTFLDHARTLLDPVDEAVVSHSAEGVHRAAHGLRAALLMVGALPASERASELEHASLDEVAPLRAALALELARITAELELVAG